MDAERNRDADLANTASNWRISRPGWRQIRGFVPLEKAARSAFRGYGAFRRLFSPNRSWPDAALPADENQLFEELQQLETKTRDELERFEKIPLPRLFKFLPLWLLTILLLGWLLAWRILLHPSTGIRFLLMGNRAWPWRSLWVVLFVIHQLGKRPAAPAANTIAGNLARARKLHDGSLAQAE